MRAIFLCEKSDQIFNVYDIETVCELQKITNIEKKIYKKEDVISSPDEFWDVDAVFSTWGMPEFTEEEIKRCFPSLECVFYGAGTVQKFARPFLNCGVKVFSSWAANAIPVAEMTVAEIILANKGYFLASRLINSRGNRKLAVRACERCKGNYGETVGIIGVGAIGRHVIGMLKQYKLKVIVFDTFLSDEEADRLGVQKCELAELFERAFVISNHLADKAQTRGILNYDLFRRMREDAVFINTARGAQVVEDDLVRILRERPDLTALLDVTYPEPPVEGHPFYTLPNCQLTPHIAGSTGDEVARLGEYALLEYKKYLSGEECSYEVSRKMLETMA